MGFAVKCTTSPVFAVVVAGSNAILCSVSATTCTVISPCAAPPVATRVAVPGASPFTRPESSTFAIAACFELQRIATSVRGSPFAERAVAVNTVDPPTTSACFSGATSTVAGGGVPTVTVANPGLPATTAPTVTCPAARNTTVPSSSAPAISGGKAIQIMGFTSIVFPVSSLATAVNLILSPTCAVMFVGVISTVFGFGGLAGAPTSCPQITGAHTSAATAIQPATHFEAICIQNSLRL